jgi:hypothetical protein
MTLTAPWGTSLNSSLSISSRRGYSDSSMNTDEFVDFKGGFVQKGFNVFSYNVAKDFFDEQYIFISRNKSDPEFIATLPKSIIIDDKKEKIEALKTVGRFDLFWLNRKDDEIMDGKITTTRNLNEFTDMVIARAA